MTLEEIFKDKPELLREPAVQKLINYTQEMHTKMNNLLEEYRGFHDKVLCQVINSELIVLSGKPCKEVVTNILEELEKI